MKVRIINCIIVVLGVCASTGFGASQSETKNECKFEEYDIMSVLITAEYGSDYELILINTNTETWSIQTQMEILLETWPTLEQETIDSLILKNSGVHAILEEKFDLPATYLLISKQEFCRALQDSLNPDWDNFDTTYPDAQGYLTFSRVGFDSKCSQALLIFSNAYRCSGTRISPMKRKIAYFKKTDGSWILKGISKGFNSLY